MSGDNSNNKDPGGADIGQGFDLSVREPDVTVLLSSVTAADNDNGLNWCSATTSYGDGDLGTPGSPNPSCL